MNFGAEFHKFATPGSARMLAMKQNKRFRRALVAALLLHVLLLLLMDRWWAAGQGRRQELQREPIWLSVLHEPERPRQLIEVAEPSEEKPENTDFIAEAPSRAATPIPEAGEKPGPAARLGTADRLAAPPTEATTPAAQPLPVARGVKPASPRTAVAGPRSDKRSFPAASSSMLPLPAEAEAKAALPAPVARPLPPGTTETRERGASARIGFAGFEAIQSELAPYLKSIQAKVELRWNEALLTRYFGTIPTVAEVRCEIAQDGRLVRTEILGAPKDVVFAGLCQHAIQRAAPFGAFPFTVPPEYRNQNLEIHWTFNFL